MTTDELLNLISRQALGSAFQSEIQNTYQSNADAEEYGTVESDYTAAINTLTKTVSKEKLLLLAEYTVRQSLLVQNQGKPEYAF